MNIDQFKTRAKQVIQEKPLEALAVGAAAVTAAAKLIDATSAAKGRRAYTKQVNYRVKNKK